MYRLAQQGSKKLPIRFYPLLFFIIMSITFLSFGCNSGSDFAGGSGKKNAQAKDAAQGTDEEDAQKSDDQLSKTKEDKNKPDNINKNEENTPPVIQTSGGGDENAIKFPPPEKCDPANGATYANLLSPVVVLGTPTSEVVYEISITDCTGKLKNINAESISFDFDGEMGGVGLGVVLQYRLVAEGVTHNGVLEARAGQDLFGNAGPEFYHFITTQKVSTTTKSSSVRLAISLKDKTVRPRGGLPAGSTSTEFKLKTFLRFGNTTPVAKEVSFSQFGGR